MFLLSVTMPVMLSIPALTVRIACAAVLAPEERTSVVRVLLVALSERAVTVFIITLEPSPRLSEHSESTILAGVSEEGGPLGRAPRNSVNAEMIALQALSVLLQVEKDWDKEKYHRCHPGGKLGQMK